MKTNKINKSTSMPTDKANPIFIHSLWRSGSTYLFSVFRRSPQGYWCYQEPINEIALYSKDSPEILSTNAMVSPEILRHPSLDKPYFQELFDIWPNWRDEMNKQIIFDAYFGIANNDGTTKYLQQIIKHSKGRPVIQECRTSCRIDTLKRSIGGFHFYLWRNPLDQWWSYKASHYFDTTSQLILNTTDHPEVINLIRQEIGFKEFHHEDLTQEYSHFSQIQLSAQDSYRVFYLLWCLGILEGISSADLLINIDSLSNNLQYRQEISDTLLSLEIDGLDFSDCSIYQSHFTASEKISFTLLEDRVHGLLLACGYPQRMIDQLLYLRNLHMPQASLFSSANINPKDLLIDAERAREIVTRYETRFSGLLLESAAKLVKEEEQHKTLREELTRQSDNAKSRESVFTQQCLQKDNELEFVLSRLNSREKELNEQRVFAKEATNIIEEQKQKIRAQEQQFSETLSNQQKDNNQRTIDLRKQFDEALSDEKQKNNQQIQVLQKQFNETLSNERQQNNQQIQVLQKHFSDTLASQQINNEQLIQSTSAYIEYLKQKVQTEQQLAVNLRESLATLQVEMNGITSSFFWVITLPLRKLASLFETTEQSVTHSTFVVPPVADTMGDIHDEFSNQCNTSDHHTIPIESESMPTNTSNVSLTTAQSVDELLSFFDEQFINSTYLTLLGRAPDPVGNKYYLGRLRAGYSKARIITQIAESSEAKTRGTNLSGLQDVIAAEKKARHWLWGVFSRNKRIELQLHRLENEIGRISNRCERTENLLDLLSRDIRSQPERQANLPDKTYAIANSTCSTLRQFPTVVVQPKRSSSYSTCSKGKYATITPLEEFSRIIIGD